MRFRDLKPENLLLDINKDLKVVDFGLSNVYEVKGKDTLKTAWGSPWYAAPEMIAGQRYHGDKVDVWSVGIVLYAMVCGYLPFEDPVTKKLYKKIMSADYKIPKYVSNTVKDLMTKVLNTDPDERYTIDEIMKHPWFNRVSSFPWPLTTINGKITEDDKQEFLNSRTSGGVNTDVKPVPVNMDVIDILDQYGLNKEYAIKWVELNKHNSVTSTYYLIIKNKKREVVQEMIKKGKNFDDVVRNEKQQLLSLLQDFGKSKPKNKTQDINNEVRKSDEKAKNTTEGKFNKTTLKSIRIPEDPIDIVQENSKVREAIVKQSLLNHNDSEDAVKRNQQKNIKRKNPRRKELNDSIEDGEIIASSRNVENKVSPSPSPEKYEIIPRNAQKSFEIGPKPVK